MAVPHELQKRASGSAGSPQFGQPRSSRAPQAMQNPAAAGFSAVHCPQVRVSGMPTAMMTPATALGKPARAGPGAFH
jgi:hypothetical protein